jgi:hypothetical protein
LASSRSFIPATLREPGRGYFVAGALEAAGAGDGATTMGSEEIGNPSRARSIGEVNGEMDASPALSRSTTGPA